MARMGCLLLGDRGDNSGLRGSAEAGRRGRLMS